MKRMIIGAAVLALALPVAAVAAEGVVSVPARTSGLDLQQTADAAVMLKRLDTAASKACGASSFSVREWQAAVRRTACYTEAMDQAVTSLNAPTVTSLYRQSARSYAAR